jgi:hypothetical protein
LHIDPIDKSIVVSVEVIRSTYYYKQALLLEVCRTAILFSTNLKLFPCIQYISFLYTSRKPYSPGKEVLYSILIESSIPIKLIRLIKICLNENYNKVLILKHLSYMIALQNGLFPLLFIMTFQDTIRKARQKKNQNVLELNGPNQLLVCAVNVNLLESKHREE